MQHETYFFYSEASFFALLAKWPARGDQALALARQASDVASQGTSRHARRRSQFHTPHHVALVCLMIFFARNGSFP